ncbi:MAG: 5-(carboxyamino)imidazole ribonucleotide mutase [bacterium]|nr:5-(carboxyamino)imidazole ribonucleotide mutase [bacterium]
MARILVCIGSPSDKDYFKDADSLAVFFGLEMIVEVLSAHRNAAQLRARLAQAAGDGVEIIIAAAGMAAHLAGVCAAETNLPVIGVPLPGSSLGGLDALLSTVQMPAGVPVATMAIGAPGARNAVILAARILGLKDSIIRHKLDEFKAKGFRL